MDAAAMASSPFITLLVGSVALLLIHIMLQGMLATKELGSAWNAGPRDENLRPQGRLAGRAARASANFRETYPAFVGLVLALVVTGDASGWGLAGAWVWVACRILYVPLYLAGIPPISVPSSGSVPSLVWSPWQWPCFFRRQAWHSPTFPRSSRISA